MFKILEHLPYLKLCFSFFSPFKVDVQPGDKANKVKVGGPGVDKEVTASLPQSFTIDCREAGPGDVLPIIQVGIPYFPFLARLSVKTSRFCHL